MKCYRHGKRTDYNNEPFIPVTSDVEEQYQKEMKGIQELENDKKRAEQSNIIGNPRLKEEMNE